MIPVYHYKFLFELRVLVGEWHFRKSWSSVNHQQNGIRAVISSDQQPLARISEPHSHQRADTRVRFDPGALLYPVPNEIPNTDRANQSCQYRYGGDFKCPKQIHQSKLDVRILAGSRLIVVSAGA